MFFLLAIGWLILILFNLYMVAEWMEKYYRFENKKRKVAWLYLVFSSYQLILFAAFTIFIFGGLI